MLPIGEKAPNSCIGDNADESPPRLAISKSAILLLVGADDINVIRTKKTMVDVDVDNSAIVVDECIIGLGICAPATGHLHNQHEY